MKMPSPSQRALKQLKIRKTKTAFKNLV
uniref:Uncharacterized protein n=1 Tax=Anguilla anguilla TaxID=7936 RepID=A0A0E9V7G5_ANGAN